jgi:hypothetical protein
MTEKTKKPASAMQAARAFAEAKVSYDAAVKAKKVAEQNFIEACAKEGVEFSVISDDDGRSSKVFVRRTVRTKVILDKLRKLVKPAVIKKLVVEELDQKLVASAVGLGILDQAVVDQASEVTPVVSVMIAELDDKEEA